MMLRSILQLAVMAILVSAGMMRLHSQDLVFKNSGARATLVELYSSEGCSSCPPAETWLSKLKTSRSLWTEVFPVAFHVDYWDGLGWPDRFAKPAYTQRQRNYAEQLGQQSVYTPEFVTSGREWRGWFHGEQSPPAPAATSGELSLNIKAGGKTVSASYLPASQVGSPAYTVNIALLGINVLSNVKSGENGGRQLRHDFVVLDFESMPMISGQRFESGLVDLKPSTNDPSGAVVAWVSDTNGSIVQVAGGWLKPLDSSPSASAQNNRPNLKETSLVKSEDPRDIWFSEGSELQNTILLLEPGAIWVAAIQSISAL